MTVVRFLSTPVATFVDLQGGLDALQRELHIGALAGEETFLPPEVVEGIVVHREALDEIRTTLHEQTLAARHAGHETVDLEADYPEEVRARIDAVVAASRGANAAAEAGVLLTPPLPEPVRHLQEWMYRELEVQLAGGQATPYEPPRR